MEERTYSIQELCELSGMPRRTIHFYTQQGILPPPESAGVGAYYSEAHCLRLLAIPALRAQGKRLDEIRRLFETSDFETLKRYASQSPAPVAERRQPRAQAYIHYILGGGFTLIAPAEMNVADQQRLEVLLDCVRDIFPPVA